MDTQLRNTYEVWCANMGGLNDVLTKPQGLFKRECHAGPKQSDLT